MLTRILIGDEQKKARQEALDRDLEEYKQKVAAVGAPASGAAQEAAK